MAGIVGVHQSTFLTLCNMRNYYNRKCRINNEYIVILYYKMTIFIVYPALTINI